MAVFSSAQVVRQLRKTGRVQRPYLGIHVRNHSTRWQSFVQNSVIIQVTEATAFRSHCIYTDRTETFSRKHLFRCRCSLVLSCVSQLGLIRCFTHPQILELTPAMAAFISDRDKSFPGVTSGVLIPRVRSSA